MSITAASVEANGWVLRLTVTASLGSFANYNLDPNTTPRVTLASSHAGFVKSAGTAIAGSLARSLVATKPLRKPVNWNGSSLDAFVVDEIDNGGGSITVRLALSEHVYASDTALSLTVLAGWRSGEGAASSIAVTNNSTTVAPIPILRWARPSYDVAAGAFRLSLIVASHHPVGFDPVAGVKFTATDGTTVKTVWATALATDNDFGDNLRCYTVTIDPANATALTAGLLRCDAEVYPYLGAMRSTDAAGTRAMANLGTTGLVAVAAVPFVVGYDPAGTRYNGLHIYVDPVNGTTTAAAAMVQPSLSAAKALALASRPRDVNTALQAMWLTNRTLAAANGQAAQTRAFDGLFVVLAPGTHIPTSAAVSVGPTATEIPVRVIGDPDDGNPRGNCIWQTPAAAPGALRILRVRFANLTLQVGGQYVLGGPTANNWLDNVTILGKPGFETSGTALVQGPLWAVTRARMTRVGIRLGAQLLRNTESSRDAIAAVILKHRFIGVIEDTTGGDGGSINGTGTYAIDAANPAVAEDLVIAYCDLRNLKRRSHSYSNATAAAAGTPNPSVRRQVFLGNICEKIDALTSEPFFSVGENSSATMSYNIIEANSFVGERSNSFYSDPVPVTIADTNTQLNQAFVNRIANNFHSWMPSKHDAFLDTSTANVRGTGNGYRPQMVEAWSYLYGVGHEGNCEGGLGNSFAMEFYGLRSIRAVYSPGWFASDRSVSGSNAGGGDYQPVAGSPLAGLAQRGSSDRDIANVARSAGGAAGAFQGSGSVGLAPAPARSTSLVSVAGITLSLALAPAMARHTDVAVSSVVHWFGMVVPQHARSVFSGIDPMVSMVTGGGLVPASARLAFGDLPVVLLVPSGIPGTIRTLQVGADGRTIVVKFN